MIFTRTPVAGVVLIQAEPASDERGSFTRIYCEQEFAAAGLETRFPQRGLSSNTKQGTLRGMHYSVAPETKLVTVMHGAIFDVVLDLRAGSATYLQWFGVELAEGDGQSLYVPAGVAHGFQTLRDATQVHYALSEFHDPAAARGARWDDPAFAIAWPQTEQRILSARDATYPDFRADE